MSRPVITLTTDFGLADGYAGAMKGVILRLCPGAIIVDVSHDIPPQAILQAAYVLSTIVPHFPAGSVHLAVVDPGVGTARRPIAVQTGSATYVAPDNGLLSLALVRDAAHLAVHLQPAWGWAGPGPFSATFHGRDLFAPAAARLACGAALTELGEPISPADLVSLPGLQPRLQPDGSWLGQVLHVDRFGNLITNLQPWAWAADLSARPVDLVITVGEAKIAGLKRTFGDVEPGELVAYLGSSGPLEIAVRDGNAAARLRVAAGDPVRVAAMLGGVSWRDS